MHEGTRPYHPLAKGRAALDWGLVRRPEEGAMHHTVDETSRRGSGAGSPGDFPVSRRRFLALGVAWAVGLAAFAAAGCGGEEEEDGGEDDD